VVDYLQASRALGPDPPELHQSEPPFERFGADGVVASHRFLGAVVGTHEDGDVPRVDQARSEFDLCYESVGVGRVE
jgi:hypothetical protein